MTNEQRIALVMAGYSRAEIEAMATPTMPEPTAAELELPAPTTAAPAPAPAPVPVPAPAQAPAQVPAQVPAQAPDWAAMLANDIRALTGTIQANALRGATLPTPTPQSADDILGGLFAIPQKVEK